MPEEHDVRLVTVEVAAAVEPAALDATGGLRSPRALGHASVRALDGAPGDG